MSHVEIIVNSILNNPALPKNQKKGELIPFNPVYVASVEHATENEVHADGNFPAKLIDSNAPNESKEEFDYRKLSYQPYTMPFWHRAITATQKKWNKANYKVSWKMESVQFTTDNRLSEQIYFEQDYPQYKSIYSFNQSMVDEWRNKDPNAVIAVYPPTLPTKEDEDGKTVIDRQELLKPEAIIFPSIQVMEFTPDYTLLKTDEVRFFKDVAYPVFVLIDDEFVHRILEKPIKENVRQFDYELEWFEHKFKSKPAWKLRGRPVKLEDRIIYKSQFSPALPHLNIALWNQSTFQASMTRSAFPQSWSISDTCHATDCINGVIYHGEDESGKQLKPTKCEACNGSGDSEFGPLKNYRVDWPKMQSGENKMPIPPFGWESPDTNTLELRNDHIKDMSVFAFTFINIDVSPSQPKGSDTALKAKINQNEQYAFLLLDMNMAFDLMENMINAIGIQRYGEVWKMPDIVRPIDFTIRTVEELTEELFSYFEKKMPAILKGATLFSLFEARFGTNAHLRNVLKVLLNTDVFITFTEPEFTTAKGSERVPQWMSVLHDNGNYLATVALDNEDFLTLPVKEQRVEMKKLAEEYNADNYPAPVSTTQSIVDLANLVPANGLT